jgi:hypothetical protein
MQTTYLFFNRDSVGNEEPRAFCPLCGFCSQEFDSYTGKRFTGVFCAVSQKEKGKCGKCGQDDLFLICPGEKHFYNILPHPKHAGYEIAVCHGKEGLA